MTYCVQCKKPTNNNEQYEFTSDFSSKYKLVIVSCEECGTFKHSKLEEVKNV